MSITPSLKKGIGWRIGMGVASKFGQKVGSPSPTSLIPNELTIVNQLRLSLTVPGHFSGVLFFFSATSTFLSVTSVQTNLFKFSLTAHIFNSNTLHFLPSMSFEDKFTELLFVAVKLLKSPDVSEARERASGHPGLLTSAAILIWKVDKMDFVACLVDSNVEIGLFVAIGISFFKILLQVTRPATALLGNLPGTRIYRNIEQYPEAVKVPRVLIVRVGSAIYFSNANYVMQRTLRWLTDEDEELKKTNLPRIEFLVVEMSSVTNLDTSGIHSLEDIYKCLKKREVQLLLANPGPVAMDKLQRSKLTEIIGQDKIFLTTGEAVLACIGGAASDTSSV